MRASKSFKVILLISVLSLMIPGYAIPSAFALCTAPPSNMISWWPGDGNALDIQDNNDGTLNGDATFAAGKVGQAFSLDGSGDFVEVANESNFDFADSKFAVDGWFKTSEAGKRQMIVTKAGFTSGFSWQVEIATNNKLVTGLFQGINGLNVIVKQSTNTLNDGAWHHFAVNFDNKDPESATLYIDGVLDDNLVSDVTGARTVVISNEPVIIGARNIATPQLFFNGLIDEVEIFDRFLTAQEIKAIFDADSDGKCKEPSVIEVEIDIKPGSDPNCFNNDGKGVIPIAILGSSTFDVTQVDPLTLSLDSQAVKTKGNGDPQTNIEDVNGDGFDDLVVKIIDTDGTYQVGTGTATLTGQLFDGTQIEGTDSICITQ